MKYVSPISNSCSSDFAFLGQTGAENLNFFRFDNNGTFALARDFRDGPQDGNSYAFRVFAFRSTGGLVRMDTGTVGYSLDTTTGSPTDASVKVFDDETSNQPLISETDFDDISDRKLDIRWIFDGNEPITDWHVYVKRNDGGFFFLGRTGNGSSRSFLWANPDVNAQYQFRVWGLFQDDQGVNRLVVLSQPLPIGYDLDDGAGIKLKQITNSSDLPAETAILVDDLFHNTDLSGGTDVDGDLDRAIGLKWNPGRVDISNTHILIRANGGDFVFLGQTGAENLNFFRFDNNGTFALASEFQDGPQLAMASRTGA